MADAEFCGVYRYGSCFLQLACFTVLFCFKAIKDGSMKDGEYRKRGV